MLQNVFIELKYIFLALFINFSVSGCGGGGGSSPAGGLTGTWTDGLLEITISGLIVTSITEAGIDLGITGTLTRKANQIYSVVLSDGLITLDAIIITDASGNYIGLATDELPYVLQKSVIANPNYLIDDINFNWSGLGAGTVDFISFDTGTFTASCLNLTCSATTNTGTTSTAFFTSNFDSIFGYWGGVYTNSLGGNGDIEAAMSMDKRFMMVIGCDSFGQFPESCDFSVWVR